MLKQCCANDKHAATPLKALGSVGLPCSRIVDRALDDHLEHIGSGDAVAVTPLPVDGPGSTLRGWEAADEGGALGVGFQNIAVDAAGQVQCDLLCLQSHTLKLLGMIQADRRGGAPGVCLQRLL